MTTETSLYATPIPRRRIPPRAVSVTASWIPGWASTCPAPLGPEKSPYFTSSPSKYTPSVLDQPTCSPAARPMCAIIRDVVVLPFVPVTATTGTFGRSVGGGLPGGSSRTRSPTEWISSLRSSAPNASSTSTIAAPSARARPSCAHGNATTSRRTSDSGRTRTPIRPIPASRAIRRTT